MSDDNAAGTPSAAPADAPAGPLTNAGALLRAARQAQGLHAGALATALKVTPAKLQALEEGRLGELPDLTFARALALTVCRHLKIDPAPVLAQLPGAPAGGLEKVDGGLNTPFRDRPGQADPAMWLPWRRPLPWLVALLLVLAAAFVLVPMRADLLAPANAPTPAGPAPLMPPAAEPAAPVDAPANAASAPPAAVTVLSADTQNTAATGAAQAGVPGGSVPPPAAASGPRSAASTAAALSAAPAVVAAADNALLRAAQDTWVQVTDASGQTLTSRLIPAGETVEFAGKLPLKLRIGNARGTELHFRGQKVDLAASTRDNIATLSLP